MSFAFRRKNGQMENDRGGGASEEPFEGGSRRPNLWQNPAFDNACYEIRTKLLYPQKNGLRVIRAHLGRFKAECLACSGFWLVLDS